MLGVNSLLPVRWPPSGNRYDRLQTGATWNLDFRPPTTRPSWFIASGGGQHQRLCGGGNVTRKYVCLWSFAKNILHFIWWQRNKIKYNIKGVGDVSDTERRLEFRVIAREKRVDHGALILWCYRYF